MKRLFIVLIFMLSMSACAHLPRIDPDPAGHQLAADACRNLFPQGRWQLFHSIEATLPGGEKQILTGVSVLSSEDRSIQWALMTVEGFVIFSGRWNGTLTVDRAVPPFDRDGFAEGLMEDLRLLFFAPRDPLMATGRAEQGDPVCRFGTPDNTIDIIIKGDGSRIVHQYASSHRLTRSIVAGGRPSKSSDAWASDLILKHHGIAGYQLELKLIEAIPIDEETKQ
jgi:hypothetical protein